MRALTSSFVEAAGLMAAALTTACWIPQAARTIRTRETHGLSLPTYVALFAGNSLWLVYGLFIMSWPLIGANRYAGRIERAGSANGESPRSIDR